MALFTTYVLNDQIEQIQRRSVKIICPGLSYMDGLKELNLSTLVDRRELLGARFYMNNFSSSSNISDLLPRKKLHLYIILKTPEIFRFLSHTQVAFIIVFCQLVYVNGICPDIASFNSIVLIYYTECKYSYCIYLTYF